MFGSFGIMELLLILFIVLIIFGAGKLPQLGEGIGKSIKGFKKTVHEADEIGADPTARPNALPPGSEAASPATIAASAGTSGEGTRPPHT